MGIDTKDREKIAERTTRVQNWDYRLHLVNEVTEGAFSFLAVGDSGSKGSKHLPKYKVADEMDRERKFDLILHLGDVVYSSGSEKGYKDRFIGPYHHWLKDGNNHEFNNMIFTTPFLPVYGNHDYYDLHKAVPILGGLIAELIGDEIGDGSHNGKVFQEAFVGTREQDFPLIKNGLLLYETGTRTRIPNRYYWFTHGRCAFFALDSNTLDGVEKPDEQHHAKLKDRLTEVKDQAAEWQRKYKLVKRQLDSGVSFEPKTLEEMLYEIVIELADLEKEAVMLDKYLDASGEDFDRAQLKWLKDVLQHKDAQGKWKIVYMHHPLYSSDGSHTDDPESDGLRANLRDILKNQVHLVLSGHSHCFEWLMARAEAERQICYLVSGGGGRHLRRSILEDDPTDLDILSKREQFHQIAESKAYTAIFGKDDIFHYLRIDVSEAQLKVTPVGIRKRSKDGDKDEFAREAPIRTKVLSKASGGIAVENKKLRCINVFRDRSPEAEFLAG